MRLCLVSFVIPFLVMLGIFILNGVYPFDDWSFMHSDMYHQYVPFLSELIRRVREGGGLLYSRNVGIGSNFIALYAYYTASPFNWLMLLFPEQYLIEFMSYMVIVKIGLCGFAFAWYLTGHFRTENPVVIPFAVFYALSGFLAAYNWNVMWLDCIFLFPLIALGLEGLVAEGKYRLYCISLALCILSNYYISIMICLFLVLYFLLLVFTLRQGRKQAGWSFLRFALYSGLAGGMAAVLLIPEYAALHLTKFSEFQFPKELKLYFPVLDMLARHCINVPVETGLDHWPNLYCGVAVFLFVPLYLANRRIPLREKAARAGLLFFLLISFSANVLNFIWHGLNYPDSLPCRQSFLYIFLLLSLCCEALLRIRECSLRTLGCAFCLSLSVVILLEKLEYEKDLFAAETFLITLLFLCLYGALLYVYREGYNASDRPGRRALLFVLIFLTTSEAAVNMYHTSCSVTSRSKYLANNDSYTALAERTMEADPDFYRFEKSSRRTKNDGTLIGFPSASLFSSTANGNVEEFYEKLGMSHSKVFYCHDGATPFSSALLSVRYLFSLSSREDPALYTPVDQEGEVYLYQCRYTLPAGFLIDAFPENSGISSIDGDGILSEASGQAGDSGLSLSRRLEEALQSESGNPLEIQNRMAGILGTGGVLFSGVGTTNDGSATLISVEEEGHYYAWVGNTRVDTLKMESEQGSKTFTKLKYHYICDLGYHEAGDIISLTSEDSTDLELSACRMNPQAMEEVLSILGRTPLVVDSFDSTHLTGHIQADRDGDLILSIPWEPGWSIRVDDRRVEAGSFAGTMISIPLTAGEHTIRLSYCPTGLIPGSIVSLLCLLLFLLRIFMERAQKPQIVRQAEENGTLS